MFEKQGDLRINKRKSPRDRTDFSKDYRIMQNRNELAATSTQHTSPSLVQYLTRRQLVEEICPCEGYLQLPAQFLRSHNGHMVVEHTQMCSNTCLYSTLRMIGKRTHPRPNLVISTFQSLHLRTCHPWSAPDAPVVLLCQLVHVIHSRLFDAWSEACLCQQLHSIRRLRLILLGADCEFVPGDLAAWTLSSSGPCSSSFGDPECSTSSIAATGSVCAASPGFAMVVIDSDTPLHSGLGLWTIGAGDVLAKS